MFEIVRYKPEHLAMLKIQQAQSVLSGYLADEALAVQLGNSPAWTGLMDGRPVAVAGLLPKWPGVSTGWALFVESLPMSAWLPITRMARM